MRHVFPLGRLPLGELNLCNGVVPLVLTLDLRLVIPFEKNNKKLRRPENRTHHWREISDSNRSNGGKARRTHATGASRHAHALHLVSVKSLLT